MRLRRDILILSLVVAAAGCKKKFEIIPAEAKQISRSDKNESTGEGMADVSLREYKFTVNGSLFLCESRVFAQTEQAIAAAQKTIAHRPQEEQKSEKAHFAWSGRSLWLRANHQLTWCMLSSDKNEDIAAAIGPLRSLFLQKYKEST